MKFIDRHDVVATLRSLRQSRAFVAIATISLGLAIGLSTTTFAIVDAVKHPYVPFKDAEALRGVLMVGQGTDRLWRGHEMYMALRARPDLYESMASYDAGQAHVVWVRDALIPASVVAVSTNYFEMLGVQPYLGRTFRRSAADAPRDEGVVVSYKFWQSRMSRALPLAKVPIRVDDEGYTVIGVMPPTMSGAGAAEADVWLPMARTVEEGANAETEDATNLVTPHPVIRVRAGRDNAWLRAQLAVMARRFTSRYGRLNEFRYVIQGLTAISAPMTGLHEALTTAALVVFLIACANIANLLVARVVSRQQEIAVRMAIGASQGDIARFVVVEAVVLALLGGVAGTLLSTWGIHLVEYRLTAEIAKIGTLVPRMNWRTFGFAVTVTASTVLFIATAGVVRARSINVNAAMKDGSGSTTVRTGGLHRWFVAVEVALSLIVIMSAALLVRVTSLVTHYDFGYDRANLLSTAVSLPGANSLQSRYAQFVAGGTIDRVMPSHVQDPRPDSVQQIFANALAGVRGLPGVTGAAMYARASNPGFLILSDLGGADPLRLNLQYHLVVSPDFLRTLRLPIVQGRDFLPGDDDSVGVAIVDDSIAKFLWPHESPVGHQIKLGRLESNAPWVRVVGVARSSRLDFYMFDRDLVTEPTVYVAQRASGRSQTLVVRTGRNSGATQLALYRDLRAAVPGSTPRLNYWMPEYENEVALRRFLAIVFAFMGAFALGLSTVGLYSVLAYAGIQRTREFAMRIALGAQSMDLIRLVMRDGVVLVLAGTAAGAMAAVWCAGLLKVWLFGVAPFDALALIGAESVLIAISLLAVIAPAMRAARVNPVELLRAM